MRRSGCIAILAASVAGGLAAWWLVRNSRLCAETARYRVLRKDGDFEIRDYDSLLLASTPDADHDESFARLLGYISGENSDGREIAMTTPVLISEEAGRRTMSFVMPRAAARAGAPKPMSLDVERAPFRGGKFAVYRYAGFNNLLAESGNAAVLRGWMRDHELEPDGEALIALYDPPWVPAPMRRNEVLLRIAERA